MKNILLTSFVFFIMIISIKSNCQDSIRKTEIGITIGFISWNHFYNSEIPFNSSILKSTALYPVTDLVIKFPILKKSGIALNISDIQKANQTTGGIQYKLNYLTMSPLFGKELFWKNTNYFLGFGPYFGILYKAKKGDEIFEDKKLKPYDYGIEFIINFKNATKNQAFFLFDYYTLKFQLGMNDVYYFKTMSCSMSIFGYVF
jgi:hypothetical protein